MPEPLLRIRDLAVTLRSAQGPVEVVGGVSIDIARGEVVALVGESGSGKTVTALSIAGLLPEPAVAGRRGEILFDGVDLARQSEAGLRAVRGRRIAYVFQEPATALNPVFTIGYQLAEVVRIHGTSGGRLGEKVADLLNSVGLASDRTLADRYPHQLSGGQQQRVMIAMALAGQPDLLIADEPTTALDVTVQAQILDLLQSVQRERGMAVLLITHNLAIAAGMASRIYVMYAGQVVESGLALDVLKHPAHPYTRALLRAVPRLHGDRVRLEGIPGTAPAAGQWPGGCRFHPRCPMAEDLCRRGNPPPLQPVCPGRQSRCPLWTRMGAA